MVNRKYIVQWPADTVSDKDSPFSLVQITPNNAFVNRSRYASDKESLFMTHKVHNFDYPISSLTFDYQIRHVLTVNMLGFPCAS